MKGLVRISVPLLVAASVFAVVAPGSARPPDVVAVDQAVPVDAVDDALVAPAAVAIDDLPMAHVLSPVRGQVTKIHVRPGQRVRKGDPLATIEAPDFDPTSDVLKAEADLIAAQHDLKRQKQLFELGEGSRDFEAAIDRLRQAKAELATVRARMGPCYLVRIADAARVRAHTYTVTSPIDGQVLTTSVVVGMFVEGQYCGGAAQELFVIGEPAVWRRADVSGW